MGFFDKLMNDLEKQIRNTTDADLKKQFKKSQKKKQIFLKKLKKDPGKTLDELLEELEK